MGSEAPLGRALVTGGAGFIGSNLADRLAAEGVDVVVYDNFSTGQEAYVEDLKRNATIVRADVLDRDRLTDALRGCDTVFHLAANADLRHGLEHPFRDLEQNVLATSSVLESMHAAGVSRIVFSSTGSVYGEPDQFPTPETCAFPVQTSLYGASKVAAEGLIEAYCEGYGFEGIILRFVSILGERYSHGHLFDFYRSLRADPTTLTVLGNGQQRKSYLDVGDCVDAIELLARRDSKPGVEIFNLGTHEVTTVDFSVAAICDHLGVQPEIVYTGGERGWVGDSPLIHLDCARIRALGWRPNHTIADAVRRTLGWFDDNEWVFEERNGR